jgi:hypothetical protein
MERGKEMNTLDNYEEGSLWVTVRRHWWQFWLSKKVIAGSYTTIGNSTTLCAFGQLWRRVE